MAEGDLGLPRGGTVLSKDDREILRITFDDGESYDVRTGSRKIVAYDEYGQGAFVPWLAVINYSDEIIARVPAHMVVVEYRT